MKALILLTWIIFSNDVDVRISYIQNYKDLAIIEMHRKGIPASITLAQAILESNSGQSSFARSTNNHFGIKCKKWWRGEKYMHEDDDYDEDGNIIESCFRAYDNVFHSYVDHSNFIAHNDHYRSLFDFDIEDYKSWANGLAKCGYATDKDYAEKLIRIIETHELHVYDSM